jgi:hypothetical protein
MTGKKILAVIFALLILVKVAFLLVNPGKWMGIAQTLASHTTGLLVGLNLIPYAASLHTTMQKIATVGVSRAWLALLIWVAIAVAVLVRVFAKAR